MANDNGNSFSQDALNDLLAGKITLEQLREQLESVHSMYVRVGKNYKQLKFENPAKINGEAVNVYTMGEKVDYTGKAVAPKPRTQKSTAKKTK